MPGITLFTLRTVVIVLVALLAALVVGTLTYLAGNNTPAAVLARLGAFGATLFGAHKLIQ